MLHVSDLHVGYGRLPAVVNGVSLEISEGELVGLLGPNGAGKSTTLRAIAGLLRPRRGEIALHGEKITGRQIHAIARKGLRFVPEELRLFEGMTVYENLVLASYAGNPRSFRTVVREVYELFPFLQDQGSQPAGTLSGGQRKALALGRALISRPSLLLIDEPSIGLAPLTAKSVFEAIEQMHVNGMTILLVEQNVPQTLNIADRAYILENGRLAMSGLPADLAKSPRVREAYLGVL